jgi:hypothetical protein
MAGVVNVSQNVRTPRAPELRLFHIELNREIGGRSIVATANIRARDEHEARILARDQANLAVSGPEFEVVRVRALG